MAVQQIGDLRLTPIPGDHAALDSDLGGGVVIRREYAEGLIRALQLMFGIGPPPAGVDVEPEAWCDECGAPWVNGLDACSSCCSSLRVNAR